MGRGGSEVPVSLRKPVKRLNFIINSYLAILINWAKRLPFYNGVILK